MKRVLAFLFTLSLSNGFSLAAALAADEKAVPRALVEEIASPAAPGAVGASLVRAPDGQLWLSWVQPGRGGKNALRLSMLDRATNKWSAPRTIADDTSITTSTMDFPQLAVTGGGQAVAIWTDGHGGARLSRSADRGATWGAPEQFPRGDGGVEKFSLATLADGRVLIAWLDSRQKKSGGKMQALYARVLGTTGADALIDSSVCDCCQTTLTAFRDGGALVAYRARTDQEVRDIRVARFRGDGWDDPRPLNNDDWRINACPVNGPRLDNDRGRVSVAWFTAADNEPHVLASYSPDAGARFLVPLRLDRGAPLGHVDTAILRDGALLVTWVEKDGSLWLRRVSPDFAADEPVELASPLAGRVGGFPRLTLVRDYAGGRTSAQCVVVFGRETKPATLHALLVTVPEGDLMLENKNCDCAPTAEQLQGLPLRGRIIAIENGALQVRHGEVPGVLRAGTRGFRAAPEVLAAVAAGRDFLGRIEEREGAWWVFDVRLIASAPN